MYPSIISPSVLYFIGSTHADFLSMLWMIIWYLFPQLDLYGSFPVWYVYMVFLMLYVVIKMLCLLTFWLLVLSLLAVLAGLTVLVECTSYLFPLVCPFCVYSESVEILVKFLMLMSGQVR